ncbi:hypothetical protein [Massilia sp. Se16.2.3]|uniref:hypothetical protein n=1 Tax=Massilia sp. Se16.2.3 TaxID=2709303 RepID=UPI001E4C4988|nr:hypothetical protein [Massilia sp. Se16.2.3]
MPAYLDDLLAPEERSAPPLDTGTDVVGRLRALLGSGDGAAIELVEAAGATLRRELGERTSADLSAAVTAFDYERALELLGRSRNAGTERHLGGK